MIDALERGDLKSATVDEKHRHLLQLVELLTRHAYKTTESDIERLRSVGWYDEQIAEAVYVTAILGFFNRVADGFGLERPRPEDYQTSR